MSVIDYQICLAQTTEGAETWVSFSSFGGSQPVRVTATCGMDCVTFKVNSATAGTDDELFAYHAKVRIRKVVDSTPSYWFVGRVKTVPRHLTGSGESYTMRIDGPWSWFQAATYRQPWAAAGGGLTKPRVILFCDSAGARVTTGAQIIDAANFALAAGAPIATVTSATVATGFTPPYDEQISLKVDAVIIKALSYHPHAVTWFDYSGRDAVFHCASRLDLASVSKSIVGRKDISIEKRTDMQAPAIAICYEQTGNVDGEPVMTTTLDWAPVVGGESTATRDARLAQADVVWACYNLQGASITTASQLIEAEAFPFPLTNLDWWKARVPTMSEYADADITLSSAARLNDSTLTNLLIVGAKQPWMSISVETERVRVNMAFIKRATIDGTSTIIEQGTKSITLEVQVTGAPTGETLYRCPLSVDEGEPVPSGIAAQLYAEWAQLHYQGSIVFKDTDLPGDCLPGKALNLTGGRDEWTAMNAMIIRCSEDVDAGETTVEFGIPDWTDVDSRVAFDRATRTRKPSDSRVYRTGFVSDGVTGSLATVLERDGNVDAAYVRQLYLNTGSVHHMIVVDANGISKSVEGTTASVLQAREMYLPYVDTSDSNKIKAKLAQVMASALYGTAIEISPINPVVPSTFDALNSFWGEYSGASGGGSAPTTNAWVASGLTGHSGKGFKLILTLRSYIDNSAATPNFYSEQVMLQFSVDGRLLACSVPWSYIVSPTVAV